MLFNYQRWLYFNLASPFISRKLYRLLRVEVRVSVRLVQRLA